MGVFPASGGCSQEHSASTGKESVLADSGRVGEMRLPGAGA
jgi:hypothetical protein